ncbi:UPF0700 transmembrane protein YoaK [Bacillus subtilis subsp. subtilis]|uniref:YoaK family protein n=1 Tax=Bacillus subtilis TaxID=1423 RepID=UPI000B3EA145|nr:YoaK family protein [Bacillus subtilis]ARV98918.1 UPF0700 transmembrane protein YoaK [Bacillus subtilis subsp. subtilis]ARW02992.1 UPF0700 transmembrane protein YoaK [Bacillus subtilis subsp. subtilis]ASB57400.1 UPF0700 transmembrane protein YoaK [Bacillus subtilis subsp. subtilis]MCA0103579.1 DUF1275 domain-containing protein [Bacillus subtilis]QAV88541.1 DUF1275 domain-containing protein [Bacillus subtilis]
MTAAAYRNTLLSLLCLTAGIVDVIGYLSLGHVFTANMTGNIVLLGLAIGKSIQVTVFNSLTALIGFICGVIIATLMVGKAENTLWPSAVTKALALEAFILFVFACLSFYRAFVPVHILIILMSISMGIQTTAAKKLGIAGISSTVLTGTLASLLEDISGRLFFKKQKKTFLRDTVLRALAIILYCVGAIIVALAESDFYHFIIWVPIVLIFGIMMTAKLKLSGEK